MNIGIFASSLMGIKTGAHTYAYQLLNAMLQADAKNRYKVISSGTHKYMPQENFALPFDPGRVSLKTWREPRFYRFMLTETRFGKLPLVNAFAERIDWRVIRPFFDRMSEKKRTEMLLDAVRSIDLLHVTEITVLPDFHKPSIVTLLDMNPLLYPDRNNAAVVEEMRKGVLSHISQNSFFIAISENTKKDFVVRFDISPDRVRTIYLGADPKFYPGCGKDRVASVRNRYGIGERPYIAYAGRVDWNKNIENVIIAFKELLRRKRNKDHALVIAGPAVGKYSRKIAGMIEELGLAKDVVMTGYVSDDDLPALVSNATLFVSPSYYEGFGLAVLEAMACGVPAVTSNVSSLPEVVGDAAIMVSPEDVGKIAASMEAILYDDRLRNELKEKSLKRAQMFRWENTAKETLKMYQDVAVGKV